MSAYEDDNVFQAPSVGGEDQTKWWVRVEMSDNTYALVRIPSRVHIAVGSSVVEATWNRIKGGWRLTNAKGQFVILNPAHVFQISNADEPKESPDGTT